MSVKWHLHETFTLIHWGVDFLSDLLLVCVWSSCLCFLVAVGAASLPSVESWAQIQTSRLGCRDSCIMSSINNKEMPCWWVSCLFSATTSSLKDSECGGASARWPLLSYLQTLTETPRGGFLLSFQGWTILWSVLYWHIINKHKAACLESKRPSVFECVCVCM